MINLIQKYKSTAKIIFLSIYLPYILSACSSPQPHLPLALEQAHQAELAAHRAMHEGDLTRAREHFTQALWLQQSVDNTAGLALDIINLATISHKQGNDKEALFQLDRILLENTSIYPPELRAAAAFRKAVILTGEGDKIKVMQVESALQLAENNCSNPCSYTTGIANLRARIALQKRDYTVALQLAKITLDSTKAEKEEVANAHRISASAEIALERHEAALAHYKAALTLDKELGISSRIIIDLRGISFALDQLDRKSEAEAYARRSIEVTEAVRLLTDSTLK